MPTQAQLDARRQQLIGGSGGTSSGSTLSIIQQRRAQIIQPSAVTVKNVTISKTPTIAPDVQKKVATNLQKQTPAPKQTSKTLASGIKLDLTPAKQEAPSAQRPNTPELRAQQAKSIQQMDKVSNYISSKAQKNFPATTQAFTHLFDQTYDPKGAWNAVVKSFKEPINLEKERIKKYFDTYKGTKPSIISFGFPGMPTNSKQAGAQMEAITGAAGVIFSPITALFAASDKIPVLGTISRAISIPFSLAGESAAAATGKLVDVLPLPAQDKANMKQGLQEIASLAAQLALGKASGGKKGITEISDVKKADLVQKYGFQDAITIQDKAQQFAKLKNKQIKEGQVYTPDEIISKVVDSPLENTPEGKALIKAAADAKASGQNVQVGLAPKIEKLGVDTPVYRGAAVHEIDTTRPNGITGGVSFSTDKAVADRFAKSEGGTVKQYTISKDATIVNHSVLEGMTPRERTQFIKTNNIDAVRFDVPAGVQGESEIRVLNNRVLRAAEEKPTITTSQTTVKTPSKIGVSIERKAIEQGLTKGFEGVAGYDKITIKEQARLASDLFTNDFERARRIIRGEEPLPPELRGGALIKAMEDVIKKNGNGDLAHELANSPLVSRTSAAAQELRLAAEREPDSLAARLQALKDAKEKGFQKRTGQKVDEAIKKEVDRIKVSVKKPDKYDWKTFIDTIEC